jgi:hypothetical protein
MSFRFPADLEPSATADLRANLPLISESLDSGARLKAFGVRERSQSHHLAGRQARDIRLAIAQPQVFGISRLAVGDEGRVALLGNQTGKRSHEVCQHHT